MADDPIKKLRNYKMRSDKMRKIGSEIIAILIKRRVMPNDAVSLLENLKLTIWHSFYHWQTKEWEEAKAAKAAKTAKKDD